MPKRKRSSSVGKYCPKTKKKSASKGIKKGGKKGPRKSRAKDFNIGDRKIRNGKTYEVRMRSIGGIKKKAWVCVKKVSGKVCTKKK